MIEIVLLNDDQYIHLEYTGLTEEIIVMFGMTVGFEGDCPRPLVRVEEVMEFYGDLLREGGFSPEVMESAEANITFLRRVSNWAVVGGGHGVINEEGQIIEKPE